jgi:hypothetical protein
MSRYIAIEVEDEPMKVHAASALAGYTTLCGLDGGTAGTDQRQVELPRKAKIDCEQCLQIFTESRRFRMTDFSLDIRT